MTDIKKGGCFYTDGGKRDFGGWGIHGFTYNVDGVPLKNIKKTEAPTNYGYLDKKMPVYKISKDGNKVIDSHKHVICDEAVSLENDTTKVNKPFRKTAEDIGDKAPLAKAVKVENYIDAWGSLTDPSDSNNTAEVTAALRALKYSVEKGLDKITIISDSEYTVLGSSLWRHKWEANRWKKKNGDEIPNVDKWKEIASIQNKLIEEGKEIQWMHVYGHSGEKGNDLADRHATRGINLAVRGLATDENGILIESGIAKYEKPDNPYTRLLAFQHWYFKTNTDAANRVNDNGEYCYYIGSHRGQIEMAGKPAQEHTYGVVYTKEKVELFDELVKAQEKEIDDDYEVIISANLSQLFLPKVYGEIKKLGLDYVMPTKDQNCKDLILWEKADKGGIQLTSVCNPPRIAPRIFTYCDMLELLLNRFRKEPEKLCITNITSSLMTRTICNKGKKEKVVYSLSDCLKNNKPYVDISNVVKVKEEPSKVTTRLTVGIDLPPKNAIGKLIGEDFEANLITWKESDFAYRFAVVIKNEEGIGIYCSVNNNLELVK